MRKAIVRCAITIALALSLLVFSLPVAAADIPYTVSTWSTTFLENVLKDVQTRTPGWFNNYRYFSYVNTTANEVVFTIVPRTSSVSIVYWMETTDADLDLDKITVAYNCSAAAPCISYMYNPTGGAYIRTYTRTTNLPATDVQMYNLAYTNIQQLVRYWYFDGTEFIPMDSGDLSAYGIGQAGGGMPAIPSSSLVAAGITQGTDQEQTDQLIDASWGMFNWLRDGLNTMFNWVLDALAVVLEPLADMLTPTQAWMDTYFAQFNTLFTNEFGFLWYPFDFVLSLFDRYLTVPAASSIYFGKLFGSDFTLDLAPAKAGLGQYWDYLITLAKFGMSFGAIAGLWGNINAKLKGQGAQ